MELHVMMGRIFIAIKNYPAFGLFNFFMTQGIRFGLASGKGLFKYNRLTNFFEMIVAWFCYKNSGR